MDKEQIKKVIRKHKTDIEKLGVNKLAVFGSYVSGQNKENSDIDIYVSFRRDQATYDNFIKLCYFLDKLFPGKKVDVVTEDGVSPYIEPEIKRTAEYV